MSTNSIRRHALIASSLFLGISAAISPAALAEELSGENTEISQISVAMASGGNFSFNFLTDAADVNVATATVQSNDAQGYVVSLSSANAGKLKSGSNEITYTLKYDGVGATLSTTPTPVKDALFTAGCARTAGCTQPVLASVNKAAAEGMPSGTYTDTLTFTVTGK